MIPNLTIIRFLVSDGLSLLGNSVAGVALPLILLAVTGDPLAAGTLALICAVPQVIAGVLGGALLDRFNRRSISILSDLISASAVAALPLIDMTIGLSFGWFVLFGVLGAIGDIPGMTARDTLLPSVAARDNVGLQQFMGIAQSLASLVTIIGPALAAFLMGVIGIAPCLWITAALSLCAALVTMTLPRSIGTIENQEATSTLGVTHGVMSETLSSLKAGLHVLFKSDHVLTASFFFSLAIVMVLGSFQGLILPVFFTYAESPELLGYTLSALSAGLLIGSLVYAVLAQKITRRAWYVGSLIGMFVSLAVMGSLPAYPFLLGSAFALGISAGPASSLLGFFMLDRIPEDRRGSALGTQNSLMLVAAPIALFVSSVIVSNFDLNIASLVLILGWFFFTVYALTTKRMKNLDDHLE